VEEPQGVGESRDSRDAPLPKRPRPDQWL
jgi:hypothetical protein